MIDATTSQNARKGAQNLYTASRRLLLDADNHELMAGSHTVLQEFITEAEAQARDLADLKKKVAQLEMEALERSPGGAS